MVTILNKNTIALTTTSNVFYKVSIGSTALTAGTTYYILYLIPQTGGANPNLVNMNVAQSNNKHAFITTQSGLETLPATVNISGAINDMYWTRIS